MHLLFILLHNRHILLFKQRLPHIPNICRRPNILTIRNIRIRQCLCKNRILLLIRLQKHHLHLIQRIRFLLQLTRHKALLIFLLYRSSNQINPHILLKTHHKSILRIITNHILHRLHLFNNGHWANWTNINTSCRIVWYISLKPIHIWKTRLKWLFFLLVRAQVKIIRSKTFLRFLLRLFSAL